MGKIQCFMGKKHPNVYNLCVIWFKKCLNVGIAFDVSLHLWSKAVYNLLEIKKPIPVHVKRLLNGGLLLQWNDGLQNDNNKNKANMFIDLASLYYYWYIKGSAIV